MLPAYFVAVELVVDDGYSPSLTDVLAAGTRKEWLHERAREATRSRFGSKVFVRAVVEASNFCRENCSYCGMRADNRTLSRYRAQLDDLTDALIHHRPSSVTDVNIQTGEDPVAVREVVIPLIEILKRETPLGISVCLGTLSSQLYAALFAAGASSYIMKFECADARRYQEVEAPGTLDERLEHIRVLAGTGWVVSSGFIAGLPGQAPGELVRALELAGTLPISGCSVSPFIPGDETPLGNSPPSDPATTLNCMASLRLMQPEWVIPAVSALNLAEVQGYQKGLRAGANLATINLTPSELRGNYLIYKRERFIMTEEHVLTALAAEGLHASKQSLAEYHRQTRTADQSGCLS